MARGLSAGVLLGLLALAVGAWHITRFGVVVDDSYIALRTAANWVSGGTPEYNRGSGEWVPTSFLWVAVMAAAMKVLPGVAAPLLAKLLGGLFGMLTLVALWLGAPRLRWTGGLAALLCAGSAVWAAWPLSGMETSFFGLAVVLATCSLLRLLESPSLARTLATGALFGVTSMVRLDGAVFFVVALAVVAWRTRDLRTLLALVAAWLVAAAPALAYLAVDFQVIFPVSWYAKVNGFDNVGRGLDYVFTAARTYHLAYAVPLVAMALWDPRSRRAVATVLLLMSAWLGWVVGAGGDFMPYHRFLNAVWPLLALAVSLGFVACAASLAAWRPRWSVLRPVAIGVVVVGAVVSGMVPTLSGGERVRYEADRADEEMRQAIGRFFTDKLLADEWIAVKPAGIIPYFAGVRAVDFFSIVDRKAARGGSWVRDAWIGHQHMNAERIHEIAPRIVILEARLYPRALLPPPSATDPNHGRTWLAHAAATSYAPARAEIVPGYWLNFYVRTGPAPAIAPAGLAPARTAAR